MRFFLSFVLVFSMWSLCSTEAADADKVKRAIERGVKYLKNPQVITAVTNKDEHVGKAALVGLALIESNVPVADKTLSALIKHVRDNCITQTQTYDVALCLIFLDRVEDPKDLGLIQYLGRRLVVGQESTGGWSYTSGPELNENQVRQLKNSLTTENELKNKPKDGSDDPTPPKNEPKGKASPKESADPNRPRINPDLVKWIQGNLQNQGGGGPALGIAAGGDNSNTQFGTIGLWCARKHGVPVDAALARTEQGFRNIQMRDGGWGYIRGGLNMIGGSSPTMTCSGLIGLAVGIGLKKMPKDKEFDVNKDMWVKGGLMRLGGWLADAQRGQDRPNPKEFMNNNMYPLGRNYYFLWSLERTAVIFGLDTIGNQDWFGWGSEVLVTTQNNDGSWSGGVYHGADINLDTCFAVLFLNKANVAKDLTANLKGKVRDPGNATLKGSKDLTKFFPEEGTKKKSDDTPSIEPKKDPPKIEPKKTEPTVPVTPMVDAFAEEAQKLCDSLVKASGSERGDLLTKLRDSKGAVYTEALARATQKLDGEPLKLARDALASRLVRMTASTLREMLKDENREIRRAASLACGMKDDKNFAPDLIETLTDRDPMVARAARASLKSLSGQDFGPETDATVAEKAKAIAAWKAWWEKQK